MSFYLTYSIRNIVYDISEYTNLQSNFLDNTIQNITEGSNNAKNFNYSIKNSTDINLTYSIYGFDFFKVETNETKNKTINLSNSISRVEGSRYKYSLAIIILLPLLASFTLVFYFLKRPLMIMILSICIFMLVVPQFIMMAMNSSYFFLSIDLCENLNSIVTNKAIPISGEGIGFYTSCPSKV